MSLNDLSFEEVKEIKQILHCQLWMKGREVEKPKWIKSKKPNCNRCKRRFRCHTMRGKLFRLTITSTVWTTYEVFAEDREDVSDLYFDWGDEPELMREIKSDGDGGDMDIEEVPELTII